MDDRTASYLAQMQALLPPGPAWPREPGAVLSRLLTGLAPEYARVDRRGADLRDEADPRTTTELLPEWERVCGLPDPCSGPAVGVDARRAAVVQRWTATGGQSPAYYVAVAATLGYAVTIEEFRPFRAGHSAAGDALHNGPWAHTWRVRAAETPVRTFQAGVSVAGDPLRAWGEDLLECVLQRLRPAQTVLLFGYGEL